MLLTFFFCAFVLAAICNQMFERCVCLCLFGQKIKNSVRKTAFSTAWYGDRKHRFYGEMKTVR